jgi:hypothetical protein
MWAWGRLEKGFLIFRWHDLYSANSMNIKSICSSVSLSLQQAMAGSPWEEYILKEMLMIGFLEGATQ